MGKAPSPKKRNKPAGQAKAKRFVNIRINPEVLTEDDVDYLYALQHKDDPSFTLDQFLNRIGYEMVRPRKKAS